MATDNARESAKDAVVAESSTCEQRRADVAAIMPKDSRDLRWVVRVFRFIGWTGAIIYVPMAIGPWLVIAFPHLNRTPDPPLLVGLAGIINGILLALFVCYIRAATLLQRHHPSGARSGTVLACIMMVGFPIFTVLGIVCRRKIRRSYAAFHAEAGDENVGKEIVKGRWYQFRLRTLLAVTAGFAVVFSLWSAYLRECRDEQLAVEALRLARAWVVTEPGGPQWLRELMGKDFVRAVRVDLSYPRMSDVEMEYLEGMTDLRELHVWNTQVTDAGLEHVEGLRRLRVLVIWKGRITDAGLRHVRGLRGLRVLQLLDVPITDAGLKHLEGLHQLERLHLKGTQVSQGGLVGLKKALPGVIIDHTSTWP